MREKCLASADLYTFVYYSNCVLSPDAVNAAIKAALSKSGRKDHSIETVPKVASYERNTEGRMEKSIRSGKPEPEVIKLIFTLNSVEQKNFSCY